MALNDVREHLCTLPSRYHDRATTMTVQGIVPKQVSIGQQTGQSLSTQIEKKFVEYLIRAFVDSNGEVQNVAVKWCTSFPVIFIL